MSRSLRFVSKSKTRLTLLGALIVALAATLGAVAYWTTTGTGTGSAASGTLSAPVIASATPGAGTVALDWSPGVTPPGTGAVTYYVTRDGGTPAGNCPTSGSTSTATSCTDTGLSAGGHSYTVTAEWRSWTSTSATTNVTLSSGAATQIVLSGAVTSLASGVARTFTATVEDAAGNTVTSGADSTAAISFSQTSTPPGSASFATPSATSGGVATDVVTGNVAGPVTIKAAGTVNGSATNSNTLSFTVIPGAVNAAKSTLTPTSASIIANGVSTQVLTVQAKDANGNSLTTGGSTVVISRSSGSGTIGAVADNGDGTYTATVTSPTATGSGVFIASLGGSAVQSGTGSQTTATITYTPGPANAAQSTLTPTSASIVADGVTAKVLTVQAKDANGNNLTTGGATVVISRSSGTGTIGAVTDNTNGTYTRR